MKSGVQTTEFWLTITATLVMILTVSGVFDSADQQSINDAVGKIVTAVVAIVSQATYIWGRVKLKGTQ